MGRRVGEGEEEVMRGRWVGRSGRFGRKMKRVRRR